MVVVLDRELVATLDGELAASLVLAALEVVEVVVLPTDATLGALELPPHPAARTPLASTAAASRGSLAHAPRRQGRPCAAEARHPATSLLKKRGTQESNLTLRF